MKSGELGHHLVELHYVPECPHTDSTRRLLRDVVQTLGLKIEIKELVGQYPSPSVLVDGVDVMGEPGFVGGGCRLDLPDRQRLETFLRPLVGQHVR